MSALNLKGNSSWSSQGSRSVTLLLLMIFGAALIALPASVVIADDGDLVWAVSGGGTRIDRGASIAALPDGSAVVTGSFGDFALPPGFDYTATFGTGDDAVTLTSVNLFDVFVARYESDSSLAWAVSAGGDEVDDGFGIAALPDGSALVTGRFQSTATFGTGDDAVPLPAGGFVDAFVAKYNSDGTLAWAERAGSNVSVEDWAEGHGIAALSDGTVLVTGFFEGTATFGTGDDAVTLTSTAGSRDVFVAMYNSDGTIAWAVNAGGTASDEGFGIAALDDGTALVTGFFEDTATFGPDDPVPILLTSAGTQDVFVAMYNSDGTIAWAVNAGGTASDEGFGIAALDDGTALVTGYFEDTATFGPDDPVPILLTSAGQDLFLAKYNSDGTIAWVKQASGSTSDEPVAGYGIAAGPDGGALVTGEFIGLEEPESVIFGPTEDNETHLPSLGGIDVFVAKFEGPPTYSISGTVTLIGGTASVEDVTMTLSGDESQTTNPASSDGTYSFTDLEEGDYTVTPTLAGYIFEPVERGYAPLDADQTNQDFVGTAVYSISGTVTLIGGTASVTDVTLTLSGDTGDTISPNGDGTYSFSDLEEGNYTVMPTLAGYIFEPVERSYAPLNADQTNQDFVGTAVYNISGTVTLVGGTASVTDVTLTLSGDATETISPNSDGTYSFSDLETGTYTVTPSLASYMFVPDSRMYINLESDHINQDYEGTFVPPTFGISGTVTLVGGTASVTDVALVLTGDALGQISPQEDGTYAFGGLLVGNYTVTPSLAGYVFEPANREYTPLGSDQTGQDFVGTFVPGTFSISGTVTLIGGTASVTDMTLELRGDAVGSVNPEEDGTYAFTDLPTGNYVVMPLLTGYTFEPVNRQYAPLESDQTEQDFVGTFVPGTFSISGTVTLIGGTASVTDVTLELAGDASEILHPQEDGTYIFMDLPAGVYIIIPTLAGYIFEPDNRTYTPLNSDQTDQDFTGQAVPVEIGRTRGGSGGPGPCFVATAAYGTPLAGEVGVLCDFRDRYLLTNRLGAACVRAYYRISPPVARFIGARQPLRAAVRAALTPIVAIARLAVSFPAVARATTVVGLAILGLGVCLLSSKARVNRLLR